MYRYMQLFAVIFINFNINFYVVINLHMLPKKLHSNYFERRHGVPHAILCSHNALLNTFQI